VDPANASSARNRPKHAISDINIPEKHATLTAMGSAFARAAQ